MTNLDQSVRKAQAGNVRLRRRRPYPRRRTRPRQRPRHRHAPGGEKKKDDDVIDAEYEVKE